MGFQYKCIEIPSVAEVLLLIQLKTSWGIACAGHETMESTSQLVKVPESNAIFIILSLPLSPSHSEQLMHTGESIGHVYSLCAKDCLYLLNIQRNLSFSKAVKIAKAFLPFDSRIRVFYYLFESHENKDETTYGTS